jgi:hypothetical protein
MSTKQTQPKEKKVFPKCKGITHEAKRCDINVKTEGDVYCIKHKYFLSFKDTNDKLIDDIIISKLLSKSNELKNCDRCKHWKKLDDYNNNNKRCKNCITNQIESRKEKKEDKITCKGTKQNGENCINKPEENSLYCTNHQCMNDYSEKDLLNLQKCSGCKSYRRQSDFTTNYNKFNSCIGCRSRKLNMPNEKKEIFNTNKLCKTLNCTYNANLEEEFKDYCGKHQYEGFLIDCKKNGYKSCSKNFCRNKLEITYLNSKCESCLKKDRESYDARTKLDNIENIKPKKKLINLMEANKEIDNENIKVNEENTKKLPKKEYVLEEYHRRKDNGENIKLCVECSYQNWIHPIEDFFDKDGKERKRCYKCRAENNKADLKRPDRYNPEKGKEYESRPERKQAKQEWRQDNHEKCTEYDQTSRARRIIADQEGYLDKANKQMKQWRDNNPDKVVEINKLKRENIDYKIKIYKNSADKRGIKFELTDDECINFFANKCHYCGEKIKVLNGIDRMNNDLDYTINNCVTCCEMCNMMKKTIQYKIFFKKIGHILSYLNLIDIKINNPKIFNNRNSCNYNKYKRRAIEILNLPFLLTEKDFYELQKSSCYICGKEYSELYHTNGIDRVDNTKGYLLDNCKSCCGDCNFMKNKYSYDDFINKLLKIYDYQTSNDDSDNNNDEDNNHNVNNDNVNNDNDEENDTSNNEGDVNNDDDADKENDNNVNNDNDDNDDDADKENDNNVNNDFLTKSQINRLKGIEKYGENKYKYLESLKRQIRTAKSNDDFVKVMDLENKLIESLNKNNDELKKTNKTLEEIREHDRLRKRKQKKEQNNIDLLENNNNKILKRNKKTPEEIKEHDRLRKRKQREDSHNKAQEIMKKYEK